MSTEAVKLKVRTETTHSVEYYDLQTFIEKVTGHKYEIVPYEEWGNDSQHRFFVDGILDSGEGWKAFKNEGKEVPYLLHSILNGLCQDGHIPAGIYLVCVCW